MHMASEADELSTCSSTADSQEDYRDGQCKHRIDDDCVGDSDKDCLLHLCDIAANDVPYTKPILNNVRTSLQPIEQRKYQLLRDELSEREAPSEAQPASVSAHSAAGLDPAGHTGTKGSIEPAKLALAFLKATTKQSDSIEDILPQEDWEDEKLSVFSVFASLFPEAVDRRVYTKAELAESCLLSKRAAARERKQETALGLLTRLRFNKVGYAIYKKEQSRRVPAVRAAPGNAGYGFHRARWRSTLDQEEDRQNCLEVLHEAGCVEEHIARVQRTVQEICNIWDSIRRPSRPAGPGRPRKKETSEPAAQSDLSKPTQPSPSRLMATQCPSRPAGPGRPGKKQKSEPAAQSYFSKPTQPSPSHLMAIPVNALEKQEASREDSIEIDGGCCSPKRRRDSNDNESLPVQYYRTFPPTKSSTRSIDIFGALEQFTNQTN